MNKGDYLRYTSPPYDGAGESVSMHHDTAALEVFSEEQRLIFRRGWNAVLREENLPNRGDYMCVELANQAVVIVRGQDDIIRAFSPVCRHRYALVASGAGNCKHFVCPYHSWKYSTSGKLQSVPHHSTYDNFRLDDYSLEEFFCEVWLGWVFVNLDTNSKSLAKELAPLSDELRPWGLARMNCILGPVRFEGNYNWKSVCENVGDCHHILGTHSKSLLGELDYENRGFVSRADQYFRIALNPINDGMHRDGVFGPLPDNIPFDFRNSWAYLIYPANVINVALDFVVWQKITPISPWRTDVEFSVLTSPEAASSVDRNFLEEFKEGFSRIAEEDEATLVLVSKGLSNSGLRPGPSSSLEPGVGEFWRWYLNAMKS